MNPYTVLGVRDGCEIEVARRAYRKLAMKYHPDREGGSERKFKEIKEAWELIESGKWQAEEKRKSTPPQDTTTVFRSSMSDAPPVAPQKKGPYAKQPQQLRQAIKMPATYKLSNTHDDYGVTIEVTEEQAFRGCVVPFTHHGEVHDYVVQPGSKARHHTTTMRLSTMIGKFPVPTISLYVKFEVKRSWP